MILTVEGFKGLPEEVRIELDEQCTLIAGRNGAGKTSLLKALGCVLSVIQKPFDGTVKENGEHVVNRNRPGLKKATVEINGGDWRRKATWAKAGGCKVEGDLKPEFPAYATSIDRFSQLSTTERYALMVNVLGAAPTLDELRTACPLMTDKARGKVDKLVEVGMWDDAHATAVAEYKAATAEWRRITGKAQYNPKAGEEWEPDGLPRDRSKWTADYLASLRASIAELTEKLRAAPTGGDLSAQREQARATVDRLKTDVARIAELKGHLEQAKARLEQADAQRRAEEVALAMLPATDGSYPECACPACGTLLEIIGKQLRQSGSDAPIDVGDRETITRNLRLSTGEYQRCANTVATIQQQLAVAESAAGQLAEAEALLAGLQEHKEPTPEDHPEAMQARRSQMMGEGEAVKAYLDAKAKHEEAAMWAEIGAACAVDGLRGKALKTAMVGFNETLAAVCKPLPINFAVTLTDTLDILIRNAPWVEASESEHVFADMAIQLTLAEIEASPIVLLDGVDIFDETNRGKLMMRILKVAARERRVVVASTAGGTDLAPDLSEYGFGRTYWIENGQAELMAHARNERAAA